MQNVLTVPKGCNYPIKPVYRFEIDGSFSTKYESIKDAANKIGVSEGVIYSAISRGSMLMSRFYLSRKMDFKLPKYKKYNRNPMLRPHDRNRIKQID
jgi:hypothetical protein